MGPSPMRTQARVVPRSVLNSDSCEERQENWRLWKANRNLITHPMYQGAFSRILPFLTTDYAGRSIDDHLKT